VVAYTGEIGNVNCGIIWGILCERQNIFGSKFILNGSVGFPENFLAYEGHPGFDFKSVGQPMLAAYSGVLTCSNDDVKTAEIDHQNGYKTRYLHMKDRVCQNGPVQVSSGQQIGTIWSEGTGDIHAHFEVLANVNGQWKTVDPYGWQGQYQDPQGNGSSTFLWKPIANSSNSPARWHPDGTLVRDVTDPNNTVYLIREGRRVGIPSESVFYAYGFDFSNVVKISHSEFVCYEDGGLLDMPPARRVVNANGVFYEITYGHRKRGFASLSAFFGQGFRFSDVQSGDVGGIDDDPVVPVYSSPFRDGTLVGELDISSGMRRVRPGTPIYLISNSAKREVASITALNDLGYRVVDGVPIDATPIPRSQLDSIQQGPPIFVETVRSCSWEQPSQNDVWKPWGWLLRFWDIITPGATHYVSTSNVLALSGRVTDRDAGGNGIRSVRVNGSRASNDTASGSNFANWDKEVFLMPGLNTIAIEVSDNSPNQNTYQQVITVEYQAPKPDETGPALSITSPDDGDIFDTTVVPVSGYASDSGMGSSGISSITINGEAIPGATSTGSMGVIFSAFANLALGENVIVVSAQDASGNLNQTVRNVTVNVTEPGQNTVPLDYIWSERSPMPVAVADASVVSLNGKIHLLGGYGSESDYAKRHYKYDPANDTWTRLADIPGLGHAFGSAAVVNGKIYVYRSNQTPGPFPTVDGTMKIYDPLTNLWSEGASLNLGRVYGSRLVNSGGRLFSIGGTDQFLGGFDYVHEYLIGTNSWIERASLPRARGFSTVHSVRGMIYVIGGVNSGLVTPSTNLIDIYNPAYDIWSSAPPAPYHAWGAASTVISLGNRPPFSRHRIVILGGQDSENANISLVLRFDPDSGIWQQLSSLPSPVSHAAGAEVNGRLYLFGGEPSGSNPILNTTLKGSPTEWAPALTVSSSTATIDTNTSATLFVRLATPPSNPHIIYLTSSEPSIIALPNSVTFNPGETLKAVSINSSQQNTGSVTLTGYQNLFDGGAVSSVTVNVVAEAPSVFTLDPHDISSDGALLRATINPNGSSANAWFEISNDPAFSTFDYVGSRNVGSGTSDLLIDFRTVNLLSNATYYYRAAAANNGGIHRSQTIRTFRTIAHESSVFDFDGDGRTDVSIFRPGAGEWWYLRSSDGGNLAAQFGAGTDVIVPGDYTGDGKADFAFFRPSTGEWFVLRSEDFSFFAFPFGTGTDIPAPADYDGDGETDPAVFRPSTGTWFILRSSDGQVTITSFGTSGDQPIAGDFDGDGSADIAIFRPNGTSGAEWWIQRSTDGLIAAQFGQPTDKAVAGDYTGDGKTDMALFRPSTGEWFVLRSEDFSFYAFPFGTNGDLPAPGDYDGDGTTDPAVFRPSSATWFMQGSTSGTVITPFGQSGDTPVPNAYVR
jgi:N-acetylneuraminic acid mutarotase